MSDYEFPEIFNVYLWVSGLMMKQTTRMHIFLVLAYLASYAGDEACAEVLEVIASKTNTYVADEYYLEIEIEYNRTGNFEDAIDYLKKTSEKAVAAIRESGVNVVDLESSSVLPDLRYIHNDTTGKIEIQDTFTTRDRMTLGSYSDLILAGAIVSALGISDEELVLSAGANLTEEASLVSQTFIEASQQIYKKAYEQAEQNYGSLGRLLMINTLSYEIDNQDLQDASSNGGKVEFPNSSPEEDANVPVWFSDKIHVTATIWAVFEWHPNDE